MIRWGVAPAPDEIAQCCRQLQPLERAGRLSESWFPAPTPPGCVVAVRNHIEYALGRAELVKFDRIDAVYVAWITRGIMAMPLRHCSTAKAVLCGSATLTSGRLTIWWRRRRPNGCCSPRHICTASGRDDRAGRCLAAEAQSAIFKTSRQVSV